MSLKKFFVNARTKILEFKRKYNLFVEKVPNIIDSAIQADKDIISQIKVEYDEQHNLTKFIFPKGILPIRFFDDKVDSDYEYFDYTSQRILMSNGDVSSWVLTSDGESVIIELSSQSDNTAISELLFIHFNGELDIQSNYNWYKILNYKGATKLYKHTFFDSNNNYQFELITPYGTPFNFNTLDTYKKVYDFIKTISCLSFKTIYFQDMYFDSTTGHNYFYIIEIEGQKSSVDDWELAYTTDTVTEL